MKKSLLVLNSLVGGAMLTALLAAGTLLYLMFSTGDEVVRRTGLFGSLFFETARIHDDGLGVTMGVASPATLAVIMVLIALLLVWVQMVHSALKRYRDGLLQRAGH